MKGVVPHLEFGPRILLATVMQLGIEVTIERLRENSLFHSRTVQQGVDRAAQPRNGLDDGFLFPPLKVAEV